MENTRLPKSSYNMLLELDQNNKPNWVTYVKNILFRFGFGHVFINQGVGNVELFIYSFKQRLSDCALQEWSSEVRNTSKLKSYYEYKSCLESEIYLNCIDVRKHKVALTKLRCSNHNLHVERGRQNCTPYENRLCLLCEKRGIMEIETELHFVSICSSYSVLRNKYLYQIIDGSHLNFINVMQSKNSDVLKKLSCFCYHAFKLRYVLLNDDIVR